VGNNTINITGVKDLSAFFSFAVFYVSATISTFETGAKESETPLHPSFTGY